MSTAMTSENGWAMLTIALHKMIGVNSLVGCILAFWAGAINTVTTLAILFERSSHVSGRLNDVGMNIVLHPTDALLAFTIWISFVFGGFLAGKLLCHIGLTRSLIVVAIGIGVGALLISRGLHADGPDDYGIGRIIAAFILPATMGIQNGLTSMLPRVGRSTHWTGNSTDIGLALARGNPTLAAHNTIVIFGFVCGAAAMGYLIGIRGIPALQGVIVVAVGFFLTTLLLCRIDRALANSKIIASQIA